MSKKRPTPRNRSRRIRVVREADLDRDQTDAIVDRGVTYLAMGRYEDALAELDRAIELRTADAGTIALRGSTYLAMGRNDQALADFDRAIELGPHWAGVIALRGKTYAAMGRSRARLAPCRIGMLTEATGTYEPARAEPPFGCGVA